MTTVKLLYGSQNFGFDDETSDRDFLEFIFPTWNDFLKNEFLAKERKNDDGSVTKVKDFRLLLKMLKKANMNDLQVLFSQEMEGEENMQWFLDNRNELTRMNLPQCFATNKGYCFSLLEKKPLTGKNLARATATVLFLESLLTDTTKLCFPELREKRQRFNEMSAEDKAKEVESLKNQLKTLEPCFKDKKFNTELFQQCEKEMIKALKTAL